MGIASPVRLGKTGFLRLIAGMADSPGPQPRVPRARLEDVARAAGVSKSTVSRVLSGDATLSVRDETRERVRALAQELG